MSRMGKGYGSEWHLGQYLRHRRGELDAAVAQTAGGRLIEWLDAPVGRRTGFPCQVLDTQTRGHVTKTRISRPLIQTSHTLKLGGPGQANQDSEARPKSLGFVDRQKEAPGASPNPVKGCECWSAVEGQCPARDQISITQRRGQVQLAKEKRPDSQI